MRAWRGSVVGSESLASRAESAAVGMGRAAGYSGVYSGSEVAGEAEAEEDRDR
jgi:hypothetical protein